MKVEVKKLTDEKLLKEIIGFMAGVDNPKIALDDIYRCEHSPMYSQWFLVKMQGVPSFVSTHFVRHEKNGCQHYVSSNRGDITGKDDTTINRYTPVNHIILCNAKHLVDLARKRLCLKSHAETLKVMRHIKSAACIVDRYLAECMVPDCEYRGNVCHELKGCGWLK